MSTEKTKSATAFHPVTLKELSFTVPEKPASPEQFSVWVRALQQNWRQGTVHSKGRSDVARSTKKPWKQKGTGRARAGSARSPLWRGGGVTFGPQARTKTLSVPKKVRRLVLQQLLAEKVANKKIALADWAVKGDSPKTAQAVALLKALALQNKKITLLLHGDDILSYASFANLPNVQVLLFDQPNAYDLTNSEYWLVLKKDFDAFKEMVGQWH